MADKEKPEGTVGMSSLILRIVPRDAVAEGYDDDELDMDQSCDLVALELTEPNAEKEISRKAFGNGHDASAYLLSMIRRDKKSKE
jgi:hypothetical protein